jgi:hypothetical protein
MLGLEFAHHILACGGGQWQDTLAFEDSKTPIILGGFHTDLLSQIFNAQICLLLQHFKPRSSGLISSVE